MVMAAANTPCNSLCSPPEHHQPWPVRTTLKLPIDYPEPINVSRREKKQTARHPERGQRFLTLRRLLGFTQEQCAYIAGVKQPQWFEYEAGTSFPREPALRNILSGFKDLGVDVTREWLCAGVGATPSRRAAVRRREAAVGEARAVYGTFAPEGGKPQRVVWLPVVRAQAGGGGGAAAGETAGVAKSFLRPEGRYVFVRVATNALHPLIRKDA